MTEKPPISATPDPADGAPQPKPAEGDPTPAAMPGAATPEALFAFLAELGIETETHHHEPVATVEDAKALRGQLPGGHCKNLFIRTKKGQPWLVVCEEDRQVDLKRLSEALGAGRFSFGSADRLMATLGVTPGSVTPFALINDRAEAKVGVVLDKAMLDHELLNYHPLVNHMTTAIRRDDLLAFVRACGHRPTVVDFDRIG
jgi:Ala-tRNA(Pro) deacylase